MPPVFGPSSLSPTRLKSCAGERGDGGAVAEAEQRDLRALEELLDDDPAAALVEAGARVRERGIAVVRHHDALAGREPVVLDDMRHPSASSAVSTSSMVVQTWASPVGTSAAAMTSLAKLLLPSSWARRPTDRSRESRHRAQRRPRRPRGCLRPDDDKVHGAVPGERGDARAVEDAAGQRFAEGHRIHARVPGAAMTACTSGPRSAP